MDGEGILLPLDRRSVAFDIFTTVFDHRKLSDFDLTRERDGGRKRSGQPSAGNKGKKFSQYARVRDYESTSAYLLFLSESDRDRILIRSRLFSKLPAFSISVLLFLFFSMNKKFSSLPTILFFQFFSEFLVRDIPRPS